MKRTLLFLLMGIIPFCLMAQLNQNFPEDVTLRVEKTGINTQASDFGPAFVENELWFSAFTAEEISRLRQGKPNDVFYNIFASPVDEKGNLRGGKSMKLQEISAGYHAGPVSWCEATNELFVTLSNYENPEVKNVVFQKANIPLKIIILKKSGNNWEHAGELPFNSSTYSVGHPAISVTGDTLIFASNIPGKGLGGTDLYMSVRKNGMWGEMVNLGDKINSPGEDMFPYLHKGKILFYASNAKPGGQGKLDIFYSGLTAAGFDTPKALAELNSPEDDFGLVIHPDEETGYFVSQKAGGEGDDDIYKVLFEFEGEYDLELLVRDTKSFEPIPNVRVNFNDNQTIYTDNNGLIKRELEKVTDYTATSVLDGYMNESVSFTTKNKPFGTLKEVIQIEKVEVGQKFVMENIYYDFDKWDILPESEIELNKLVKVMNDNPSWTVELGSHTDSRGTHAYNEVLSQRRSDSAVNYIVSKGIPRDRITAKGYGESQLVNECADGVSCTEEQHRKNRRTEFTILGMD
jgi:outer membrane protein OmpA-like peptidoglycan-associated protein